MSYRATILAPLPTYGLGTMPYGSGLTTYSSSNNSRGGSSASRVYATSGGSSSGYGTSGRPGSRPLPVGPGPLDHAEPNKLGSYEASYVRKTSTGNSRGPLRADHSSYLTGGSKYDYTPSIGTLPRKYFSSNANTAMNNTLVSDDAKEIKERQEERKKKELLEKKRLDEEQKEKERLDVENPKQEKNKMTVKVWNKDKTVGKLIRIKSFEDLVIIAKDKLQINPDVDIKVLLEDGCEVDDTDCLVALVTTAVKPPLSLFIIKPTECLCLPSFSSEECCICLDRPKESFLIPCGHSYCTVCAVQIESTTKSCPQCRCEINKLGKLRD